MITAVGGALRFASTATAAITARPTTDSASAPDRWLILDPAWTPRPEDDAAGRLGLRAVAARVLSRADLFPVTTHLLDDWAEASGVVDALAAEGTSFWYRRRLWAWRWLHERLIWIEILDEIAREHPLAAIELPGPDQAGLRDVARLLAERDGLTILADRNGDAAASESGAADADEPPALTPRSTAAPGDLPAARGGAIGRILRDLVRWTQLRPADRRRARIVARRAAVDARIDEVAREGGGRLLAVVDPAARQQISTATGPQSLDPFLGPVLARLAGSSLDPIVVEIGSRGADEPSGAAALERRRVIAGDSIERRFAAATDERDSFRASEEARIALERCRASLVHGGVDLGPALLADLIRFAGEVLPARLREVARARRVLEHLRPAALLLVDEYGRTEWTAAARHLAVPVAAIQHGVIHPWHPGYQHRLRPPTRPVPERTYCFGDYERRLLLAIGGYRPDEVVVAGSPRLDLQGTEPAPADRARLREELGVAPGERLLVVSTTFASVYRRFYTPVALAALLGADLPGVRVVIKLHPGEADGNLYRSLLDGIGAASGHPATSPAIVKDVDLYRLLAAADAHLGLYSTVLTEAVVTGTPNLLAATQASSDLLGYVAAGVAVPVRTSVEVRAELETPPVADPAARQAFLDDHFLAGSAADRIAADLLAWLAP